jgi:uncharacterized protein
MPIAASRRYRDGRAYNREDCLATLGLLEWLHKFRPADLPWPEPPEAQPLSPEATEALDARGRLRQALVEGVEPGSPRWLAGELLEYHRREARPQWWAYFDRLGKSPEELQEDTEAIAYLAVDRGTPPRPVKRSLVHTLTFPSRTTSSGPDFSARSGDGKPAGTSSRSTIQRHRRHPASATGSKVGAFLPKAIVAVAPSRPDAGRGRPARGRSDPRRR